MHKSTVSLLLHRSGQLPCVTMLPATLDLNRIPCIFTTAQYIYSNVYSVDKMILLFCMQKLCT